MQLKALVSEDGSLGIMACPSGTEYGKLIHPITSKLMETVSLKAT